MIRIILNIVFLLLSISFLAQNKEPAKTTINVVVNNIVSNRGFVTFSLYEEKGFLETPVQTIQEKIVDKKTTITFKNVKKGTYVITCYHDSNENGKIDFDTQGIPLEDIGVTNSKILFGPPNFKESKFEVANTNLDIEIKF